MQVVGVLAAKGGTGKTTLAVHLAAEAAAAGKRVLIVDLDPQASAADWWRSREAEDVELVETDAASLRDVLDAARADGVDIVLVDTRPAVEGDAFAAARLADLVLVPTTPAVFDLRSVAGTLALADKAGRPALVVVNRAPSRRGVMEPVAVRDTLAVLSGLDATVARAIVRQRAVFSASVIDGRVAREVEPRGKAAEEVADLWRDVQRQLED